LQIPTKNIILDLNDGSMKILREADG